MITKEDKSRRGDVLPWIPVVLFWAAAGLAVGYAVRANATLSAQIRAEAAAAKAADDSGAPKVIYTCSMDPQIRWDHPGQCPICSMDLIPVTGEKGIGLTVAPRLQQLAGLETARVLHRALQRRIETVGMFEPDETRLTHVTAWTEGRLDRLHVGADGARIEKGEILADVYSPELLRARDDLLLALDTESRSALPEGREREMARAAVQAARTRLARFGVTPGQIAALEASDASDPLVPVASPVSGTVLRRDVREGEQVAAGQVLFRVADLSVLWLVLEIQEDETDALRVGQRVTFEASGAPGARIGGIVTFLDPTVDPARRTVRARVPVDNRQGRFRPGQFARVAIFADLGPDGEILDPILGAFACPGHPEVASDGPGRCPVDGEALAPRAPAPKPHEVFSCVMECGHFHEEGPCPVCGMAMEALAPQVVANDEEAMLPPAVAGARPLEIHITRLRGRSLAVPRSAVVTLGNRHVLFVKTDKDKFEPREIPAGPATPGFVPIRVLPQSGTLYPHIAPVRRGAEVVVRGAYLLDSQLQLSGKLSLLDPSVPRVEVLAPAELLLKEILSLTKAVGAGNGDAAPRRVERIRRWAAAVLAAGEGIPEGSHGEEASRRLVEHVRHLAPALEGPHASLEEARSRLAAAGPAVAMIVQDVHARIYGAKELRLFRDPGTGRLWVQRGKEPSNPYRGKEGRTLGEPVEAGAAAARPASPVHDHGAHGGGSGKGARHD